MTCRFPVSFLALAGALIVSPGCSDEANTPVAREAEQATGIKPDNAATKSVTTKREVLVEDDKKIVDKATGKVISETKSVTPVTIVEQKTEKTNVKVDVGDTQTSGSPAPATKPVK